MKFKLLTLIVLIMSLIMLFTACSKDKNKKNNPDNNIPSNAIPEIGINSDVFDNSSIAEIIQEDGPATIFSSNGNIASNDKTVVSSTTSITTVVDNSSKATSTSDSSNFAANSSKEVSSDESVSSASESSKIEYSSKNIILGYW